jgi:hypothetical protein
VNGHPTQAELEGFVWCNLSPDRGRVVVAHLITGCASCRATVASSLQAEPSEPALNPQEAAAYDAAIERAFRSAGEKAGELLFQERKRQALRLLEESGLAALMEMPLHLRGLPLFEALLERSRALRHENPEEMVRLAEWAQIVAGRLEPGEGQDSRHIADLQCRACIELGNAHRVADDLVEAGKVLGQAAELLLEGTRDEFLMARLLDIQGSLYGDQREFEVADSTLDLVYAIYRRHGDTHLAGRAAIKRGTYVGYDGKAEEGIRLIQQGLELIDQARDPQLVYLAFHNQIRLLLDRSRPREARVALFNLKARGLDTGGRVMELKLLWLEAQINVGLGEMDRAEQKLREVKRGFEEAGLGYKAALAALELAAVLLRRGRTEDSFHEGLQALDVFEAIGIKREAAASVLILRQTFERREATSAVLAVLDHVIGLLSGAKNAYSPRLEPPAEE